jgi:RNA polymerase sigma-70 factor (ECF subfamily)
MGDGRETSWTLIRRAAEGGGPEREEFARRYLPVVPSYLLARWRGDPLRAEVEDAVQEVFLDCFRDGGVLARAAPGKGQGFRAFLFGVARMVALRFEERRGRRRERQAPTGLDLADVDAGEPGPSTLFDRAFALAVVREAAALHARRAREEGEEAERRVEILRLRFTEDLPIREIARRWGVPAEGFHTDYARARREFERALREVVAFHLPGPPEEVEAECARVAALLD